METAHQKFLEFIKMTQKLRIVERTVYYPDSKRLENDLEHGYQLTLLARYPAYTSIISCARAYFIT